MGGKTGKTVKDNNDNFVNEVLKEDVFDEWCLSINKSKRKK